ncbi:hypothetical protein, partial [Desulfobacter hydrogenophilus]
GSAVGAGVKDVLGDFYGCALGFPFAGCCGGYVRMAVVGLAVGGELVCQFQGVPAGSHRPDVIQQAQGDRPDGVDTVPVFRVGGVDDLLELAGTVHPDKDTLTFPLFCYAIPIS